MTILYSTTSFGLCSHTHNLLLFVHGQICLSDSKEIPIINCFEDGVNKKVNGIRRITYHRLRRRRYLAHGFYCESTKED